MSGGRVFASARQILKLENAGKTEVAPTLSKPGNVTLWDVATPRLYDAVTTLSIDGKPVHDYRVTVGFREARFEVDGFFLNGKRFQLFGLNCHELYPYVGSAMPRRVLRRDAEILRREFNCNVVRCSHYPQSEAFLDACDELGLMVWEEMPGWQYLGDEAWKELALRDVREMVTRDRNHPAIVIW
jgi:beta-galactosidase